MKILGKTITIILLIVFFVGLCVLLYPAISQYWNSKVQSRAVMEYANKLSSMNEEDLSDYWDQAYRYNEQLSKLDAPLAQYSTISGYNDALNIDGNGIMGYISIDKIGIELPIYHGTSSRVLNVAAGHIEGSNLVVGGASTHSALSAHRGLPHAKLFTDLDKLELGDTFTISVLNDVLTYQVDQIKTVRPDNTEDLKVIDGEDYCTLITCTPYGINTHRLLVRGKRIETVKNTTVYITTEAYLIDKLIVTPAVALPIIFVLILVVLFKPVKKHPKLLYEEETI